jgi:hypothetical protein
MRKDREQANVLRKTGLSYAEISERMSVPRSTLSTWFHDQKWSNDIAIENVKLASKAGGVRLVVMNTVRGTRLRKIYEDARQDAFTDFAEIKFHPLFLVGVMAYWSHGDKTSRARVSLSSTDPKMVRIFKLFLEKVCSVKNIRVQLVLNRDFSAEDKIRAYWMEKCGFEPSSFIKTVIGRQKKPKKPGSKPYYGVCNLIVNSAYLKNKILKWVQLLADEIGEEKYLENNAGIV